MSHRYPVALAAALVATSFAAVVACNSQQQDAAEHKIARSQQPRQTQPSVSDGDFAKQVSASNGLALEILKRVTSADEGGFVGPHSISSALAMLQAGARSETRNEINKTLRFVLDDDALHASFNRLDLAIAKDAADSDIELSSANALWAQLDLPLETSYLDRLATSYDAGVHLLDFNKQPEKSRETINAWISQQTHERIPQLFEKGAINQSTLAVLTNAVYFKAKWATQFSRYGTQPAPFSTPKGSTTVQMMTGTFNTRYGKGADYEAITLPYQGGRFSMLVLVPETGKLSALRQRLDENVLAGIVDGLKDERARLSLPSLEVRSSYPLHETLQAMGLLAPFTAGADFSGLTSRNVAVAQIVHKTFLKVDETGSEAAAATGITVDASSAPPEETVSLTVDRPFLLFIRHDATGAILFAGQITDPSKYGPRS
ncbi:MAG: serpin family protein [Myxococcales bacterium]|nr:serpin family protein [Myxococcales bacterium]